MHAGPTEPNGQTTLSPNLSLAHPVARRSRSRSHLSVCPSVRPSELPLRARGASCPRTKSMRLRPRSRARFSPILRNAQILLLLSSSLSLGRRGGPNKVVTSSLHAFLPSFLPCSMVPSYHPSFLPSPPDAARTASDVFTTSTWGPPRFFTYPPSSGICASMKGLP